MNIKRRSFQFTPWQESALPLLLQRLYQARGIQHVNEVEYELKQLLPIDDLLGIEKAAFLISEAIQKNKHIMIIGDFDADGATSAALAVRVLRECGAQHISYLVPNRFTLGYGLTPEIVDLAAQRKPDLLMTVDNGTSSVAGVARAHELGMQVVITDHHCVGDVLPDADAMVNPQQAGDLFASKSIAGVGVCFYVLLAVRRYLREQGWFSDNRRLPNMADYLDIVALGTVADVVGLDQNNRLLVHQGLRRIRAGHSVPGIQALLEIAKRDYRRISAADLGFAVAPRLNAAGRLDDMSLGIECLLADDSAEARRLAIQLNNLNDERREIEAQMKQEALVALQNLTLNIKDMPVALTLFDETWHQGVIGILAGRLKEQFHRPVIVFAPGEGLQLKGSARSIEGVHIRDVLDAVAKQSPDLMDKFGGHAMAAGLTLHHTKLADFSKAFVREVAKHISPEQLRAEMWSDGELLVDEFQLTSAKIIQQAGPWGQAFPEPLFDNVFDIIEQRIVGGQHLRLMLRLPGSAKIVPAIYFFVDLESWPNHRCEKVHALYQLDVNEFNGQESLQLLIRHLEAIA